MIRQLAFLLSLLSVLFSVVVFADANYLIYLERNSSSNKRIAQLYFNKIHFDIFPTLDTDKQTESDESLNRVYSEFHTTIWGAFSDKKAQLYLDGKPLEISASGIFRTKIRVISPLTILNFTSRSDLKDTNEEIEKVVLRFPDYARMDENLLKDEAALSRKAWLAVGASAIGLVYSDSSGKYEVVGIAPMAELFIPAGKRWFFRQDATIALLSLYRTTDNPLLTNASIQFLRSSLGVGYELQPDISNGWKFSTRLAFVYCSAIPTTFINYRNFLGPQLDLLFAHTLSQGNKISFQIQTDLLSSGGSPLDGRSWGLTLSSRYSFIPQSNGTRWFTDLAFQSLKLAPASSEMSLMSVGLGLGYQF